METVTDIETQGIVVQLSSGNNAVVVYSIDLGQMAIILLLVVLIALQVLQLWGTAPWQMR